MSQTETSNLDCEPMVESLSGFAWCILYMWVSTLLAATAGITIFVLLIGIIRSWVIGAAA